MIKKGDTIPGIFSIFIGAFALIHNILHPKMNIFAEPARGGVGPGFIPFICAVALIVFGIILVVRGIKQNGRVDYFQMTPEKKKNLKNVAFLAGLIALVLIAWKVSTIFYVCLPIYCFVLNKFVLKQSTKFSVIFTAVMTAFIYGLFTIAFTIRFMP
ncbi:MAG: tripartite tricarboxylate transporter TctB family protein [Oscillospiraceae bacterium]|nr:tripartite tricarboxylate transporter TctB family protein [Oscillospiraceae bacterium]